ncbi:MAG: hypothetical protein LBK82_17590 [Planctomycetaceae bacterium]|nr:hypothetical protein [Planctomycetaceae bacterium]
MVGKVEGGEKIVSRFHRRKLRTGKHGRLLDFPAMVEVHQRTSGVYEKPKHGHGRDWAELVEFALTPTRKAIPFAIVHLIHCRRVRRRNLLT